VDVWCYCEKCQRRAVLRTADLIGRLGPAFPVPMSDIDIYRSAAVLIKQHGADAGIHVAMEMDKFLVAGVRSKKDGIGSRLPTTLYFAV